MRLRTLLLPALLLFGNGCSNCAEEKAPSPAAPQKPEPPGVIYAKLPDGGRGKSKIVDVAERNNSPFTHGDAGDSDDLP